MSVQISQESSPSETPTPTETPAAAPAVTETPAPAEGAPAETPAPAPTEPPAEGEEPATPAAFTPREKFKAWREEHEVPKWIRDIVKDSDTEQKAIQLLEKATGLDLMKPKFEEAKQELGTVRGQHDQLLGYAQDLRTTFQRGDIDLWLQKLAIPEERMLQWALDKVQYSQLPPDQRRVLDERLEAQRKAYQLEQQVGTQEQQVLEQQRATLTLRLDSGLARPEVQTFAEAFNAVAGRPDAFREEVIAAGQLAWNQSQGKTTLTPDQAIQVVLDKYKNFVAPKQPEASPGQAAPGPKLVAPTSSAPSTIPNVQGKAASPMKTQPSSIDDLRKLGKEFQNRA